MNKKYFMTIYFHYYSDYAHGLCEYKKDMYQCDIDDVKDSAREIATKGFYYKHDKNESYYIPPHQIHTIKIEVIEN